MSNWKTFIGQTVHTLSTSVTLGQNQMATGVTRIAFFNLRNQYELILVSFSHIAQITHTYSSIYIYMHFSVHRPRHRGGYDCTIHCKCVYLKVKTTT